MSMVLTTTNDFYYFPISNQLSKLNCEMTKKKTSVGHKLLYDKLLLCRGKDERFRWIEGISKQYPVFGGTALRSEEKKPFLSSSN